MSVVNKNSGFTIVEFIVYTAIFALVILFLTQLLIGLLAANVRGRAREATITNAITAVNAIDHEIRHAQALYLPTSDFTSSVGQLSLVTSDNLPAGETAIFVDIYVSADGRLCIKREVGGVVCVTSAEVNVTGLDFNRIQPGTGTEGAQTIITLEYQTNDADNRVQWSLQSSTHVRNY